VISAAHPLFAAVFNSSDNDETEPPPLGHVPQQPVSSPPSDADDTALVARIRAGDVEAYERFFRRYFTTLSDFAESVLGSAEASEELVQEVLWGVWERRATWEVHGTVRAYVFSAVRYRALNALRDRRLRAKLLARAASEAEPGVSVSGQPSPDHRIELTELVGQLREAIDQLPETRRHVLTLRWDHGLSYAEIATVVGSSVKAVENQLNRTLRQLRERLQHLGP
jgi:RNA polymerase sigma-70 factor (ECF subfamily)